MANNKRLLSSLIALMALGAAISAYAVCAQNSDVIHLTRNGKKIASSDFVLAAKNPDGSYRLASYCIEGTCFSRFFGGDVSNVFFVQITDEALLKQVQDAIVEKERSVLAGNKGLESDRYRGTKNLYISDGLCAGSPLNKAIAEKIDGLKKHPFVKINLIKNNFSFDSCGYQRVITYDLATRQASTRENGKDPSPALKKSPLHNPDGSPVHETE